MRSTPLAIVALALTAQSAFAAPPAPICTMRDITLYREMSAKNDALVRQQVLGGTGFDPMAVARLTIPYLQKMSPSCVRLIGNMMQRNQGQLPHETPPWLRQPMLPCQCHGSICAPCAGVNDGG